MQSEAGTAHTAGSMQMNMWSQPCMLQLLFGPVAKEALKKGLGFEITKARE